jgi:hypothetical protein
VPSAVPTSTRGFVPSFTFARLPPPSMFMAGQAVLWSAPTCVATCGAPSPGASVVLSQSRVGVGVGSLRRAHTREEDAAD